ncbi:MAG: hypothetical protein OXR05_09915 [Gemmatimonadota bacterium]|nr:hypothetical protein [Gemmatimonadota bacterium]
MSKRLQVVMSDADLEEIRDAARRNSVTVSAWVRRTLRGAAGLDRRGGAAAVREARPNYSVIKPEFLRYITVEVRLMEEEVEAVRRRYNLRDWSAAVKEAVYRQSVAPMTKEEALAMQGVGWDGDLDEMRNEPPIEMIDPVRLLDEE